MKIITIILLLFTSFQLSASDNDLDELFNLMIGSFSSEKQSLKDSSYYNISLIMYPIWENDKEEKWLYVEQAVASNLKQPYRQRVYRLSVNEDFTYESKVYEINDPEKLIHVWENPSALNGFNKDDLIDREGCSVYFTKDADNCFSGSTNEKDCKSDFRGASYATSFVKVCKDQVHSWDQGWNSDEIQVWGAEKGAYIFDRIK